jgi:putative sterol carrier protein
MGSDEWVAAFDAACAGSGAHGTDTFVLEHELSDTGAAWHLLVGPAGVRVVAGRHPAPDIAIVEDVATAGAVQRGELSAQQAFMDGRLRVRGAVGRLSEVAAVLALLPPGPGEG